MTVTETAKAKAAPKEEAAPAPEGKAVFKVWGSAPNGVDITYGSHGTNLEGSRLPMTKTLTVDEDSLYCQVSAQLMGGGDVQCSVTIDGKTDQDRPLQGQLQHLLGPAQRRLLRRIQLIEGAGHETAAVPDAHSRRSCAVRYGVYTVGLGAVGMPLPMKKLGCGGWL
ncbi:hypothetical protein [Streptomyces sp. NBC_00459]|uniref:hypothetical protein n=1 Tax=Streptomyces sp. NBC_00459 TaxID=2975749 RepID=UPI002E183B33